MKCKLFKMVDLKEAQTVLGSDTSKIVEVLQNHMKEEGYTTEIDSAKQTFTLLGSQFDAKGKIV